MKDLERAIGDIIASVSGKGSVAISSPAGNVSVNGDCRVPAASLIKIPILLEAYRQFQEGTIDLAGETRVPPGEKVGGMGVLTRLSDGLTLTLRDLITLMIIISDNTATNLVIDQVGVEEINRFAAGVGARNTLLGRRLMDLEARKKGFDNFTSADDMIIFLKELAEGPLIKPHLRQEMLQILQNQQFNTKLPAKIPQGVPGDPVLAHKTGELPGVEHDAGIFRHKDGYVYVVGLFTGLEDNRQGQAALADIGYAVYSHLDQLIG